MTTNQLKNLKSILTFVLISLSTLVSINNCLANTLKSDFKSAYQQYIQYSDQGEYKKALPYAKQSYEISRELYDEQNPNRIASTDNYAVNLMTLHKNNEAQVIFSELLALYETKYGKHSRELQPILNDLVLVSKKLPELKGSEELKALEVRNYKLYLRHNSHDFIEKFAQDKLETTQHSENMQSKLESLFDREFDIYETDHWSIVHHKSQNKQIKKIAQTMEETYRSSLSFLVAFNLRNKPIKQKMTAVYFQSREDYITYVSRFGDTTAAKKSGGVFSTKARSLFFFDRGVKKNGKPLLVRPTTVMHEATHQVMYAFGIHSQYYIQPRWFVEGLAANFEAHDRKREYGPHTNNYSFRRVGQIEKAQDNDELIPLSQLVAFDGDDEEFTNSVNQAAVYALGAMTVRFLYQNYPDEFKEYLTILSKSRTTRYERPKKGKNVRLKQFKKAFGDPKLLDDEFAQYLDKVIEESSELKTTYNKKRKEQKQVKKQKNESDKAAIDKFLSS